jgi:hypothetical protein
MNLDGRAVNVCRGDENCKLSCTTVAPPLAQRAAGHLVQKQGASTSTSFLGGNSKNGGSSGSNPLGGALNKLFH